MRRCRLVALLLATLCLTGGAHAVAFAACPTIDVNPALMPDGTINQSYSQLLQASGGTSPYQFGIKAGALPPGLRIFGDRLQGLPTTGGSFTFTLGALDANGCTGTRSYTIKIFDPNANTCPDITIAPTTLPSAVVGQQYSARFVATGGTAPYSFTVTDSLPPGLGLLNNTLTGAPNRDGTYSFQLLATDAAGCQKTQQYDLTIVAAGCPTDIPIVIAPTLGSTFGDATAIQFSWTSVPNAIGYEVLVSTDGGATFRSAASTDANTTNASATLPGGTYTAAIRAIFSTACSTRSALTRFTVTGGTCPTAPPTLLQPAAGSTTNGTSVQFQWSAIAGAKYTLFVSTNGSQFAAAGTTNDTNLTKVLTGGKIDWYVEATVPDCATVRSATSSFTVGAGAPCGTGSISLTAPTNGTTVTSPVSFSWTPISGASSYRVWMSTDGAPATIVARVNGTNATVPLPSGSAEWYVEAIFDSCPSVVSAHGRFSVQRSASCGAAAPSLVSPINGDAASPVTFVWNAASGASAYHLWIAPAGSTFVDGGVVTTTQAKRDVPAGDYSWYVDAIYSGCPVVPSAKANFRVPETAAACTGDAPNIVSPANGSTIASPATFAWTAVANAVEYRVFASVDGGDLKLVGRTDSTSLKTAVPAGTIVWLVEAAFKGCASTHSGTSRFTVPRGANCPTEKSQLIAPIAGATVTTSPVTMSWSNVNGAERYIVLARTANGASTVIGDTAGTSLTRDLPTGTIEWWVVTLGSGCDPTISAHEKFKLAPPAGCDSTRPQPLAPADGSINVGSPVHFAWTKSANATSYRIFASTNDDEPALIGTSNTNEFTAAMPAGKIHWFVQAVFAGCPSLFSAVSSATVAAPAATCGTPDRPVAYAVAQVLSATDYHVRWTGVRNTSVYEVQEATSSDFADATTQTVTGTSAMFNHAVPGVPQLYFYRVRAVSACSDDRSAFSRPVSTRVIPPNTFATRTRGTAEIGVQNTTVQTINLPGSTTPVSFTATADKPWITITPASGTIPPEGITLTVTADPRALNVGANHGTVHIAYSSPSNGRADRETNATTSPTNVPISISLVTPVAPDTKATPPPESLIIPAVAHGPGANSSLFQSDIRLANVSSEPMKYLINFTPTATNGTQTGTTTTIQVDPGATTALDDILSSFFGTASNGSSTGMLEIRPLTTTSTSKLFTPVANAQLTTVASSRTYNVTENGTFGQFIPAIPFSQFIGKGSVLSLQQIAQSAAYRTNFGLVEAAGEPASVMLHVFDKFGNLLADIPESLQPSEHKALNGLLAANNITMDDGRVEVEVLSPTGRVSAYASVLDNQTNDPLLVSPVLKSAVKSNRYVIPGVAYSNGLANWRSDVRLYNAGNTSVNATLTYYPQGAPGSPLSRSVSISAGETVGLDNILNTTFGITATNAGGSVVVTTPSTSSIIASARTYAATDAGTIGQFVPAVTAADSVGTGERALQILQLEQSDAFRTNIGLAETTGKPATAEVSLVLPDSKVTPVVTFSLAANEFVQFPLSYFNVSDSIYNARVSVKVIDGTGKVAAYGSLVDNVSKDPTYVPAQ